MVSQLQADVTARGLSNVEIRRMDARELDLADQSFDRVLCGFTLWLLDEAGRSAAEFFRVLRQGGRCVVSTPRQAGPAWDFFRPRDIDVVGLLSAAGFRQIEVTEESRTFVLADEAAWWSWTWSLSVRQHLELLPPEALAELAREVSAQLDRVAQPDGFHLEQRAEFVVGRRL